MVAVGMEIFRNSKLTAVDDNPKERWNRLKLEVGRRRADKCDGSLCS